MHNHYQEMSAKLRSEISAAESKGIVIELPPSAVLQIVDAIDALVQAHREIEDRLRSIELEKSRPVKLTMRALPPSLDMSIRDVISARRVKRRTE
jgi:hypothetical protein